LKALILAAGQGIRQKGNGNSKPLISLLGLSLIKRVILTAKKSGIKEFQIVIGYNGEKIRKYLGDGRKLGVKIDYLSNDQWKRGNGLSVLTARDFMQEPFILLMADHLFDHKILNELQETILEKDECVLCVDRNHHKYLDIEDATKVVTEDSRIKDIGKQLNDHNGIDTGIFLCTLAVFDALEESIDNGNESLSGGIRILANRGKMKALDISGKYWIDVDDDKALKNAKSMLIEQLKKQADGPVSKILNRPVSIRITELFLKTGITPNQISLMSFIIAIFAALFFYLGDYIYLVAGGILAQVSSIIDGCDGEVARLKLKESKYGGWFDAVLDRYADALIIFGMIQGHWALHHDMLIWSVGFMALMGSFLNSYTSDKYDSIFKKKMADGYAIRMGRDIRLFIIFIGALCGQILLTLAILAIVTNFEAVRRLIVLRYRYV
jgi:CDP-L-myo-inositol myo-inositolphosphotransferase